MQQPEAADRWLELLVHPPWYDWFGWLRVRAARKLAERGDLRAREPLAEICQRRRPDGSFDQSTLALEAAFALAELGDERAVEPLQEVLYDETLEWFHPRALAALGSIPDKRAVDVLELLLWQETNPLRLAQIMDALAHIGKFAVPVLLEALADPEYNRYDAAKRALVKVGEPAVKKLRRALHSNNPDLRVRAFQVLQQIPSLAARAAVRRYQRRYRREQRPPVPPLPPQAGDSPRTRGRGRRQGWSQGFRGSLLVGLVVSLLTGQATACHRDATTPPPGRCSNP
ncbi:MAG TPA: HEAT repeat domain-containing protein, partial [Armatimonadetes bacterium]|nr:HEAT repeat domain-containing protein [Armatimonadota bacterium]